ncbi:hypothetical protein B5D80_30455 [Micromonospora wenchangensis]|uniref:Uncharacterized protein n=1 Tax=Micromonospora wenchangensis TaxID=1185415 RepID=A0A246RBM2_9ACTN|nr:hypothetical protein [Micromonospora wenchangensis]OWU98138.1 hypothetical protein B5D80_30455 [Micromonospora wenchangensis]
MTRYRLDQETAERLLSGAVDGATGPVRPLVTLLTAVRAAAAPAELRGEPAAVSAFRAAMAVPAPGTPADGSVHEDTPHRPARRDPAGDQPAHGRGPVSRGW